VAVDKTKNNFVSTFAGSAPWSADTTFEAAQFHFHAGSEHTINGVRHDLEMHVVHLPTEKKNEFFAGVLGMLFSVDNADAVPEATVTAIDNFFTDLKWDQTTDQTVTTLRFKALMDAVDVEKRWVYKGTLTTPPCTGNVYWNVLSTVYPIKASVKTNFATQLNRNVNTNANIGTTGNYRATQTVDEQDVHYMSPVPPAPPAPPADEKKEDSATGLYASAIALATATMFGY